jgi:hypothetical protein
VEDALAAHHGAADGVVVEEVRLAEDQPLGGAVQRLEVRVLRVICSRRRHNISISKNQIKLITSFCTCVQRNNNSCQEQREQLGISLVSVRAWVPDGALDSVAFLQQQLDQPRRDVPGGAGDAHRLPVPRLHSCGGGADVDDSHLVVSNKDRRR